MNTLSYLVSPKSVAVIGASDNPEKIGFQIFSNIIAGGFVGKVTPVNVHGRAILGQTCYKSVLEIPGEVELGVIVIPSAFVKAAVLECIEKKVKSLIIISAGFGEVNDEGKKLEKEIADLCRAKNIALLGPNCLGLINTKA
ncbi:MAG: CoA-binding protein, partial [Candidatus Berkelbacteria bacterium]|nr:CoA-binding protein [Candidatus Berkelbacteria bacterium]